MARQLRSVARASLLIVVPMLVLFFVATSHLPKVPLALLLGFPLFVIAGQVFAWYALRPPVLRADATEVACIGPLNRQRMPRSELAFIFRGQVWQGGRGAAWQQSYIFVAKDGKPAVTSPGPYFTSDDMTKLAQRLQVPIKGDFSVKVKDRVDPAST